MFQPVKPHRISDEIMQQMRQVLLSGKVKSGERMPTERQMAEQFGASRASVREALRGLEQQGVITIRKGVNGGVFVAVMDHGMIARPLETLLRLKKVSIHQISEARLVFEPEAARLAALRATPEDLAAMQAVIEQMQQAVRRGQTFTSYDLKFHKLVAHAARNPILEMLADSMLDVASVVITQLRPSLEVLRHVCNCHVQVFDAVQKRQPELAERRMREHIVETQARLAKHDKKQTRGRAASA